MDKLLLEAVILLLRAQLSERGAQDADLAAEIADMAVRLRQALAMWYPDTEPESQPAC